jgi:hypothetical protein
MPRRRLPPQFDPDHEPLARPPVEVDDDGVWWVSGQRLQVGRPLRRDDVNSFRKRSQPLDGLSGVGSPADQDDVQA